MWSTCHPKSDEDLKECAELGKSLNRLSQPTILTLLAQNQAPMHGYIIVQAASHSPMFGGKKPDATGIYRALKRMEEAGLVTSEWETPAEGSAKRLFSLTEKGYRCLRRWIDALACYELTLEELRAQAACALGIDLPDTPECAHSMLESNNNRNTNEDTSESGAGSASESEDESVGGSANKDTAESTGEDTDEFADEDPGEDADEPLSLIEILDGSEGNSATEYAVESTDEIADEFEIESAIEDAIEYAVESTDETAIEA